MIKNLVEKIKNIDTKNKLILSVVTLFASILVGVSIALILKNIVSLFIMLGVAFSLDFLLDNYIAYKKMYCYELADKYFNKIKENIEENQVKIALKQKVKQNKLWNAIFIGIIPLSFLIALILFCFNISLITSLTCAGAIMFTSLPITISNMGYTSFGIDVLCEVIEKIENNKNSTELAKTNQKSITFKEEIAKLTYNNGISQYRYKHVPETTKNDHIEIIEHDKNNITKKKQKIRGEKIQAEYEKTSRRLI